VVGPRCSRPPTRGNPRTAFMVTTRNWQNVVAAHASPVFVLAKPPERVTFHNHSHLWTTLCCIRDTNLSQVPQDDSLIAGDPSALHCPVDGVIRVYANGGPHLGARRRRFPCAPGYSPWTAGAASASGFISASRSAMAALRDSFTRPFSSTPRHLTQISSPILTMSSVFLTRKLASSLM